MIKTLISLLTTLSLPGAAAAETFEGGFYDLSVKTADGKRLALSEFKDKVLLIVNVASKCGYTPQYKELETLQDRYKEKGFTVLAFPSNQFGGQEPGTDKEIQSFCKTTFGVSFPVFAKIDVNGDQAAPVYTWLKAKSPGVLGTKAIKWNFTKFLVDRKGDVVARYAPQIKPLKLTKEIEKALADKVD